MFLKNNYSLFLLIALVVIVFVYLVVTRDIKSSATAAEAHSSSVNTLDVTASPESTKVAGQEINNPSGKDNNPTLAKPQSEGRQLEPEIQHALEEMTNTSSEGLVEVKSKDGYEVNLQGRFRSVPVAGTDESGEVEVRDYMSAPKKNNKESNQ